MASIDTLINQIIVEDSQKNEENKYNFENNFMSLNDQLTYNSNSNNNIENNNINKNSLNNFGINSSLTNKIASYYHLNEKENEKENKKEEEKNENKLEKNLEEIKKDKLSEENKDNLSNQKNMLFNDIICYDLYNKLNQNNTEPETLNNQNKELNLEQSIKDDFFGRDRTYSFKPRKNPYNQSFNQKEIKINEFNLENENPKNEIDSQENKENKEIPQNLPVFTETIQAKIENNDNFLPTLNDKINNNQDKNSIINNNKDININNENNDNINNKIENNNINNKIENNDINNNIDNNIIINNDIIKNLDSKEINNNIDNNDIINKDINNNIIAKNINNDNHNVNNNNDLNNNINNDSNNLNNSNDMNNNFNNNNNNINNIINNININHIDNNSNLNENSNQNNDVEKNEQNIDESEDNTYKEEEEFLRKEELRRKKKDVKIEEKKEENFVDVIEERKDEEEEDNKNDEDEEAQRKYLEEQDKKKNIKNIRDEMSMRTSALRESLEQNRKKVFEMMNKNKNNNLNENMKNEEKDIKNNNNNNINLDIDKKSEINNIKNNNNINEKIANKDKKDIKEIKNDNNKKYSDKINAKKKQLSNTVFNRLYNDGKKKEKEKEKEKFEKVNQTKIKKNEKNNINNKNKNKISNKNQNHIILYNGNNNNNKSDTFAIKENENESEENNSLNNSKKNMHFPTITDLKPEIKNNPSKIHKKQNTSQNLSNSNFIQKFINDTKNSEISKQLEQLKKPIIFDDSEYETYSFKPEINQKSINLCKKKFQKRKNSSPLGGKNNKTDFANSNYIENRRLNTPIGELLYEDAFNKKQKLENICIKEKKNIKKDGNQSLISKGSVNLILKKNELKLKEVIDRYSQKNGGKLSIVNIIQCLWEMNILREILKNSSKSLHEINFEYIKTIVEDINDKDKKFKNYRDMEEIEFIEQLWIKLNPYYENENDLVDKETMFKFLKILFSFNEQIEINKMIQTVDNFLKIINKKEENKNKDKNEIISDINPKNEENKEIKKENNEINNDNNNGNKENNINNENKDDNNINNISLQKDSIKENHKNIKIYKSLLRKKEFKKNEIWNISKLIRVFLELKKLLSNYQSSKKDKITENILKEREKELTFRPDFNATSSYFRRKEKKENFEDIHNISINSNISNISNITTNKANKKKRDFNKLYEEFMLKKKMHEQALMILRENKEKREIKMCTDRPTINKYYKIKNRKKTPDFGTSRNEFLYNLNKDILNKKKERLSEKENEYNNKEKYPFRPNISNNEALMNKSFREGPKKMPRGSEEYIKRNRSYIQFKKREKNNEQNKIISANYEKIINQKVNLPKIKDLEPTIKLTLQEEKQYEYSDNINNNINNINYDNNNRNINNINNNISENEDDDYFIFKVKTVKGRIKSLKIYIYKNPFETINNFCDENNIKKSTREQMIKKIKKIQESFKQIKIKANKNK